MSHREIHAACLRSICLGAAAAFLFAAGGCARTQSSTELQAQQTCGQQADRQFEKQNRYLMSEQDQTATPFSSRGMPGDTSQGLSDQYHRDRMVDDCMHSVPDGEPTLRPDVPSHS